MTNKPTAIGREMEPIFTVSRAAFRPGMNLPSNSPTDIAAMIQSARYLSKVDSFRAAAVFPAVAMVLLFVLTLLLKAQQPLIDIHR